MKRYISWVLVLAMLFSLLPLSAFAVEVDVDTGNDYVDFELCGLCGETYIPATCTAPSYCPGCGTTGNPPLGHEWDDDSDGVTLGVCLRCGEPEVPDFEVCPCDLIQHVPASCTVPEHCPNCGTTYGSALGHDWSDSVPSTCNRCGEVNETIVAFGTCGENLTWKLDDAGKLTISGTGAMHDFSDPDGPPVEPDPMLPDLCEISSHICICTQWDVYAVRDVVIEAGVTSIGACAFLYAHNLQSVTIPDTVTSIGGSAFRECGSLSNILIPNSVTSIGSAAFVMCSLSSVTIPDGVTSIGDFVFEGCTSLTSVSIPDSVTSIGSYAFDYCSSLTSVTYCGTAEQWNAITIGGNNTYLTSAARRYHDFAAGSHVCTYCGYSNEVIVASGTCGENLTWKLDDAGKLTISGTGAMTSYSSSSSVPWYSKRVSIKKVIIKEGVTSIGSYAFSSYDSLTSVTIPDSVSSIGNYAFSNCDSLTSVYITDIEAWCNISFSNSYSNPLGYAEKLYLAGEFVTDLVIPDSVTSISTYAFYSYTNLTSVTIPDSVTSIGDYAFFSCDSLTSITIPDSVTSIGGRAFSYCTSLTSITIPDSVTSIGDHAFSGCYRLTRITIPDSVTSIGYAAFCACYRLTGIYVDATNPNYSSDEYGVLFNKDQTQLIQASGGLCGSYSITDRVTSIGDYAFYYCKNLTSVTIPDSVTSIPYSAFSYCTSLTSVTIPDSVTSIGPSAFYNCTGLTSVTIPDSVTIVDISAFYQCTSLTSVTIGNSITSIGNYAFRYCSRLTDVIYCGTEEQWSAISIGYNNDNLTSAARRYHNFAAGSHVCTYCGYSNEVIVASGTCGENLTWKLDDAGKLTISGTGAMTSYSSSSSVPWYSKRVSIKKVIIKEGVTSIGSYAFSSYDSLTSVTIPDSVTSIGDFAFFSCDSLTSVTIPDSVTSIGNSAFSGCRSLTSITIPDSVTSVGNYAFSGCTSLSGVYIMDLAAWCNISFLGFTSNPLYCAHNLYLNGEMVTDLVIPDSVTSIGNYAFYECTSLTSITIPDSVTSIGNYAFYECTSLTSITIPDSVTSIGSLAFAFCSGLTSITIPDSITSIGNSMFYNCTSLTSITIPDSITSIGNSTFYNCSSLTSITIPDSVTSIGSNAFYYCDSLTSITIPDSVTSIGSSVFCDCTGLTSVTIPDSVTSIPYSAFSGCSSLTSITIPDSVTSIGSSAFKYCTSLTSINIPDSVTSIGNSAFYNCNKLTSLTIPDSITSIGNSMFYNCSSLTSISIPDGVTSIGERAFYKCTSLTSINIPDSVTSIGDYAFYYCDSLTSITIPDSVTSIGNSAFFGCSSLTDVIYCGTEEQWNAITIGGSNTYLTSAARRYHDFAAGSNVCTYCGYEAAVVERLEITTLPAKCSYVTGETLDLTGMVALAHYSDGRQVAISAEKVEAQADMTTAGKKTVTVTYQGASASFEIYVHNRAMQVVDSSLYPQSSHDYSNNMNQTKTLTVPGATQLILTFNSSSATESNYDYVYVLDGNGIEIAKYTGSFGGRVVTVPGDTVKIKLTTDGSVVRYGYAFSKIEADVDMEHPELIVPGYPSTCIQSGMSDGAVCAICGQLLIPQRELELGEHTWQAATCTQPKTCTVCGATEGAPEHSGNTWITIIDPTCLEEGLKARICDVCGETETAPIPAMGHGYVGIVTPPTCTEGGFTTNTCSVCGDVTITDYTDTVPHSYESVVTAPSCTEGGYTTNTCVVCGEVTVTDGVEALGHQFTSVITAPTCTEEGYTTNTCSVCGDVTITDPVPAKGHTWSAWIQTKAPTCSVEGSQTRFCNCAVKENEAIAKLPHSGTNAACPVCAQFSAGTMVLTEDTQAYMSLTQDLYIDLGGYDLSGSIALNGYKVYGKDSATDDYTNANMGYFTCVDEDGKTIIPEKLYQDQKLQRYMTIAALDGYTFHRFYLGITHVTLKPNDTGFGYKAQFRGDEMVRSEVASIGYNLWLTEGCVVSRTAAFKNTLTLRLKNFDVVNYGEAPVNACVSMTLLDGTVLESATASYSMRQMVEQINDTTQNYQRATLQNVALMILEKPPMETWQVENILASLRPEATVSELTVVNENMKLYDAWGKLSGNETVTLDAAYIFDAQDTVEVAMAGPYAKWLADYYISIDSVVQDGLYLAGNYDGWGWISYEVPSGEQYQDYGLLTNSIGAITYTEVVRDVNRFSCGFADTLNANAGATITVQLRLTNPEDPNETIVINTITLSL